MGEPAATSTPVLRVIFVDGDRTVDLGTVTVQPSVGAKKLRAVVADRVGLAPTQISASLARPGRARRVPLDDATDLAAAVAREGAGCYVQATPRRSRRGKKPKPSSDKAKRLLPPTGDLAATAAPVLLAGHAAWEYDYEAQMREWYRLMTNSTPPLFSAVENGPRQFLGLSPRCHECEAAAAAMRDPAFHRCVRDAVVTVGFRSPVGPIERPVRKSLSPPPVIPARMSAAFLGMSVY